MATLESRVGQIEGALPHLATKEDIARLETWTEQVENRLFLKLAGMMAGFGTILTVPVRLL